MIDGKLDTVTKEIDTREDYIIEKHMATIEREKKLGFSLASSKNSTIGKGKKTGSMAKSKQARLYKNQKTNTSIKKENWQKINKAGSEKYYSIDLPQA